MESALAKILEVWGVPGALLVLLILVVRHLYNRNHELQEARLTEARESAKSNAELAQDLNKSVDGITDAVNSLRDIIVSSSMRRSKRDPP
jgi:cytochrome c-type biogenesis protein CcmH/NrfF